MTTHPRRRVAVIGSGVAGLTAAYVLNRTDDVALFEASPRLGGHADTHDVVDGAGRADRAHRADGSRVLAIDTGFIVHNARTYPTLLRLFAELGVATQETDMSMSVRCDGCGLEYSGGQGMRGIIAQNSALLRPSFVRMLLEVKRFHRQARALLGQSGGSAQTLGQFLEAGHYSTYFVAHFMTPLVAAVWSSSPATALQYPARYLFQFLDNHGMLTVQGSPKWRTVVGGSRSYVERAVKELGAVHTGRPVAGVRRLAAGAEVTDAGGITETFDAVVIATHPDQALRLLADPSPAELQALGAFVYTPNPAVLHTDSSVLPQAERARAAWNYRMDRCADDAEHVQVSYDMTRLQRLDTQVRYLVSLNADIDEYSVIDRMEYAHPQYSPASVAAQALLPALNDGVTAFAGAYHGWGFHEDGARSGLAAAISLGGAW